MAKRDAPRYLVGGGVLTIDDEQAQAAAVAAGKIDFRAVTHGRYLGTPLPDGVLPGLSSAGRWNAVGDQDWGVPDHRNEGIEVVLLERGRATFGVEGRTHDLTAGDVTVTAPWQRHRLGGPHLGPGLLHWLILDVGVRRAGQRWRWPSWICLAPEDLADLARRIQDPARPVRLGSSELQAAIRRVGTLVEDPDAPGWTSDLAIAINAVLAALLRSLRDPPQVRPPGAEDRVATFLRWLREDPHRFTAAWPVARMARECGVGTTAFTTLCSRLTNQAPLQHLLGLRLAWAARRLREEPGIPVTTIALACGFSSSQYFARQFHRRYRCSASAWRNRG
jgi:AraC family L-rhamnose operon regulatory protein RhaS